MAQSAPIRCCTTTSVNGELVIPPGFYFAMGDNRDDSLDSRYWGLVPRDNIVGKPLIVFWSYDAHHRRPEGLQPASSCSTWPRTFSARLAGTAP